MDVISFGMLHDPSGFYHIKLCEFEETGFYPALRTRRPIIFCNVHELL